MRALATIALILLLVSGCSRHEADWASAAEQDTVSAYQDYLERHPDTEQAALARQRIAELQEQRAWEQAREVDTLTAWRAFLQQHPDSGHAAEARSREHELARRDEWQRLRGTADRAALEAFISEYPDGEEAELARDRIAELHRAEREADAAAERAEAEAERAAREAERAERAARGSHQVQLAALGSESAARSGAEQLRQRLAEVLGDTGIVVESSDAVHRLKTDPMSREDATALCRRLQERGQDCLVVAVR
jgi:hypothetical protein